MARKPAKTRTPKKKTKASKKAPSPSSRAKTRKRPSRPRQLSFDDLGGAGGAPGDGGGIEGEGAFFDAFALLYFAVVAALTIETAGDLSRPRAAAVVGLLVGISLFLFLVFFAMVGSLLLFRALFS